MDRQGKVRDWSWLPVQMPGVARLVAEKREAWGSDHVNDCWQRGVIKGEAGWFFAREGTLAVGTPWDDPVLVNFAAHQVTATQALLVMRDPGGADGTH